MEKWAREQGEISSKIIMVIIYASPEGEALGITTKRLERISSFDLDSEPEKIKLRKKSRRGISPKRKKQLGP